MRYVIFVLNDLPDPRARDVECTITVDALHVVELTLCVWCEHVAAHRAMILENILPLHPHPTLIDPTPVRSDLYEPLLADGKNA